jgi:hypothetical protein
VVQELAGQLRQCQQEKMFWQRQANISRIGLMVAAVLSMFALIAKVCHRT